MKKPKQFKFITDKKRAEGTEAVFFYNSHQKYKKGDSFVIPNMASFIHDVSEHGNIGALKIRVLNLNLFQILRLIWWNKLSILSIAKKEFHAGVQLLIQIELLQVLKYKPEVIILSDQINDLSYSLDNSRILDGVQKVLVKKLKIPFAIMTNNLVVATKKLREWKINPVYIFTPFNRFGYEMNPDQKKVEGIAAMIDPERIVAITPELKSEDKKYLSQHGIQQTMTNWF